MRNEKRGGGVPLLPKHTAYTLLETRLSKDLISFRQTKMHDTLQPCLAIYDL